MSRILAGVAAVLTAAVAFLWVSNARLNETLSLSIAETEQLRLSIERTYEAQRADQARMDAQQATIQALDSHIKELNEYVEAMPEGRAECLAPADVERLRKLWGP